MESTPSIRLFEQINQHLSEESDRACVVLLASWADYFLQVRLAREFSHGNSKARSDLLSARGPFGSFAAKIDAAYCGGWIEADVYHDLHLLRKIRNDLAHSIDIHSLSEDSLSARVAQLRVPRRQWHDWGQLRAVAVDGDVVLYTGERPANSSEDLDVSKLTFRMAMSVIIAVLVANLAIPFAVKQGSDAVVLDIPEYMKEMDG